ncbi:hypothetical protein FM112_07855 [Gulosibacter sp. 10]|nr:hypothetical protein FM112_07855 [Gulosibacter sp. 10]
MVREREFTDEDIQLFEAARIAEEQISPRGIPVEEELDPANKYRFRVEKRTNFAVRAQEQARRKWEKDNPKSDGAGLMWAVSLD